MGSGGGRNNMPRPLTLAPPGAPDGDAFAEIRLDYPGGVKLVISSHRNGVRVYAQRPGPTEDEDGAPEVMVDLLMPWDAWYRVRRSLFNEKFNEKT